ncbi:3-isopropylmalate dehydrogenase [Vitiosangium sp. GDMCC 1.1324]|uniref:3-isopropylmalate dehydrogenase n=1 Tax=Vitiosangium sp. (strain GDMCC 1.1324) TaxID=2138576 RepID=UPI000D39D0C9|nr:3-isopropylmalate dehydrogenase [Vitiosangium sp. GDMCC 1.1324]PTL76281.1 3-isopropylmalate dehydrogenase [Vitiosangium sp. GDMCC 1.1324]
MKALVAVLPGDGIGPEVVEQGTRLLKAVAERFGHSFELVEAPMGGAAIDLTGSPLPPETLALCQRADAVLLGAVGGPKWDPPAKVRPEQGLLALRKELGLYANLRPVAPVPSLYDASTLKPEVLRGVDLLVVRELTGGIYFGEKRREEDRAFDACVYTVEEVVRVVRAAASLARTRRKKLTSVDKANVLETSRLWRAVTERVIREEFPDIELKHLLVDACAMHLIKRPADFDVIVTENMFGDILTDEAAMLSGSIGMLPSASLGANRRGLYEPIHGSAPDIAGRGVANPYGTLLSVAMLLRHSLGLEQEAREVEAAVASSLDAGALTADLAPPGTRPVGTQEAGRAVIDRLGGHQP